MEYKWLIPAACATEILARHFPRYNLWDIFPHITCVLSLNCEGLILIIYNYDSVTNKACRAHASVYFILSFRYIYLFCNQDRITMSACSVNVVLVDFFGAVFVLFINDNSHLPKILFIWEQQIRLS